MVQPLGLVLSVWCLLVIGVHHHHYDGVLAQDPASLIHSRMYNISISSIEWVDHDIGIVLDDTRGAFRTTDGGYTWSLVDPSRMTRIVLDTINPSSLVIFGPDPKRWYSYNAGATFQLSQNSVKNLAVNSIQPHPRNSRQWLGLSACTNAGCTLVLSNDMFTSPSYTTVSSATTLSHAEWGPQGDIFYLTVSNQFGHMVSNGTSGLYMVPLFGRDHVLAFQITDHYIFVGVSRGLEAELQVTDLTQNPSGMDRTLYVKASFPTGPGLPNKGYAVLDSDPSAWVILAHSLDIWGGGWGNMYTSDESGSQFTLAFEHTNVEYGYFDYTKVLDGVYISNNVSNWDQAGRDKYLRTYITFDDGGRWSSLQPPTHDFSGRPITCTGTCALHLHGVTSYVTGETTLLYSLENAVGIIMGIGNIGDYLEDDIQLCNTYMSRDAGMTWTEIMDGGSIYEFANHGGLLMMASTELQTNIMLYSLDEGLSIHTYQFNQPMIIENILSSPGGKTGIVMGRTPKGGRVTVTVDFSDLFTRDCVEPDDYEDWSTPTCVLGETIVYSRRKQAAQCYNEVDREPVVSTSVCACTWDDWECDVGYDTMYMADGTFTCTLTGTPLPDPPANCPPGTTYVVSKGYRKIAGDVCQGGVQFEMVPKVCPTPTTTGNVYPYVSTSASVATTMATATSGGSSSSGPVNPTPDPSPDTPTPSSHGGLIAALVIIFVLIVAGVVVVWKVEPVRTRFMDIVNRVRGERTNRYSGLLMDDGSI